MKNPALLEEIKTYKGRDEELKKFQFFLPISWRKEISIFPK